MKKNLFFRRLVSLLLTLMLVSSCRSIESDSPTVTAPFAVNTEVPVQNGDFGGIMLDTEGVTAAAAAAVPDVVTTGTSAGDIADDSIEAPTEIAQTPADTERSAVISSEAQAATVSAVSEPQTSSSSTAERTSAAAVTTSETTKVSAALTTVTTTETTSAAATEAAISTTAATSLSAAETTTAASAAAPRTYAKNSYQAVNHSYVKAVWISYIELHNHLFGKSETGFLQEFGDMMDHCRSAGINTVYVHVRAFGDAYYYSSLFPFTKHLSGSLGTGTAFDPLDIMVSEAHKRGMSFHAWINPLRLCSDSDMAAYPADFPVGKWYRGSENGTYIVNVNGTWYLNPAYSEVLQLIGDNVREIVSGYDVDGIHIDDYFYPTTDAGFDSAAFAESGSSGLSAFRTANCSSMVKTMYTAAHECGTAWFGAAPQGNNNNNLNELFADVRAWCSGGYIDYFTPQIYYGFEHAYIPFNSCVDEWLGIVKGTNTKLYAGLSVYKAGNEDKWAGSGKYEWQNNSDILKRQVEYADRTGCSGIAFYSYSYLFDSGYASEATKAEFENVKTLLVKQ